MAVKKWLARSWWLDPYFNEDPERSVFVYFFSEAGEKHKSKHVQLTPDQAYELADRLYVVAAKGMQSE